MAKHSVLVLTDHSKHSDQNSIYALLREMLLHPHCEKIDIVSRSNMYNDGFFFYRSSEEVFGCSINHEFRYTSNGEYYSKDLERLDISNYSIIFLRLPRPITDVWLLWLESIAENAVIINQPRGIIETSNKEFLLHIPEVCPPIRKITSVQEVIDFAALHPIVLKPLKEYGGKGIIRIDENKVYLGEDTIHLEVFLPKLEMLLESESYLGMKFLKNVSQGDKRILVAGGEILAASLRLPREGSWLCNVAQGGLSVPADIDPEEQEIIVQINPILSEKGILLYGADTLVNDDGRRVLSEINTLSIGGFPQAEIQTGKPIIKKTIDKIFAYADESRS